MSIASLGLTPKFIKDLVNQVESNTTDITTLQSDISTLQGDISVSSQTSVNVIPVAGTRVYSLNIIPTTLKTGIITGTYTISGTPCSDSDSYYLTIGTYLNGTIKSNNAQYIYYPTTGGQFEWVMSFSLPITAQGCVVELGYQSLGSQDEVISAITVEYNIVQLQSV